MNWDVTSNIYCRAKRGECCCCLRTDDGETSPCIQRSVPVPHSLVNKENCDAALEEGFHLQTKNMTSPLTQGKIHIRPMLIRISCGHAWKDLLNWYSRWERVKWYVLRMILGLTFALLCLPQTVVCELGRWQFCPCAACMSKHVTLF